MAQLIGGRIREAVAAFEGAKGWFIQPGETLRLWNPQATRGHARALMGEGRKGLAEIDAAIEWARTVHHPQAESGCRWHRAEALIALGRAEEAIESATEALEIARGLEHHEWTAASLVATGGAQSAAGRLDRAEAALRDGLTVAERNPLFSSWAAARLALVLVRIGDLEGARSMVDHAFAVDLPLAGYEARLAQAELAAARGDGAAKRIAREAIRLAEGGGHLVSVPRLRELARRGSDAAASAAG
jgi:tetratricopeptide (TPR) repeat protein